MIAWLSTNSEVLYLVTAQHPLALQVHRKISQHLDDTIMKKSETCCITQITALSVSHKLQKKKNPPKYAFNTSKHQWIILEWPCISQWKTGCVHTRNTHTHTLTHACTHTHMYTHTRTRTHTHMHANRHFIHPSHSHPSPLTATHTCAHIHTCTFSDLHFTGVYCE